MARWLELSAAMQSDPLVLVFDRRFVADHIAAAEPGCFVQGGRVLTDAACTAKLLERDMQDIGFFTRGVKRPQHTLRSRLLSHLCTRKSLELARVKSCNQGYWREDLLAVNGFDERMIGWGPEDKECAARLLNSGRRLKHLRFSALAIHLHHASRAPLGRNPLEAILDDTIARQQVRCELGISLHLKKFANGVPPDEQPPWFQASRTAAANG